MMPSRHAISGDPVVPISVQEELIGMPDDDIRSIQTSRPNFEKLNVANTVASQLLVAVYNIGSENLQHRFNM